MLVYCCAQLWRVSSREHVLLIVQHHAITDGISLAILGRDLAIAYSAALRGVSPELPLLGVTYIDYAAWQRAQHGGDAFETELAWWRQTLTGAPGLLELPVDRPRPPTRSTAGAQLTFAAPSSVSQGLQQLATAQQTTAFVVVLAALQVITLLAILLPFPSALLTHLIQCLVSQGASACLQVLLHKYTAQEDIVVGTPYANRDMSVVQDVMGAFLNTLALRTDLSGDPSFRIAIQRARAVATQAFVHGNVPFAQVVDSLGLTRSAAFTPLYQVLEFAAELALVFCC
jgi:Condensation domain